MLVKRIGQCSWSRGKSSSPYCSFGVFIHLDLAAYLMLAIRNSEPYFILPVALYYHSSSFPLSSCSAYSVHTSTSPPSVFLGPSKASTTSCRMDRPSQAASRACTLVRAIRAFQAEIRGDASPNTCARVSSQDLAKEMPHPTDSQFYPVASRTSLIPSINADTNRETHEHHAGRIALPRDVQAHRQRRCNAKIPNKSINDTNRTQGLILPPRHVEHKMFLPTCDFGGDRSGISNILSSAPTNSSSGPSFSRSKANLDVVQIKTAFSTKQLAEFLAWLPVAYDINRLVRQHRHPTLDRESKRPFTENNLYHKLVALEAHYSIDELLIPTAAIYQIVREIRNCLKWFRDIIDHNLAEIEQNHNNNELRDFVAWAYDQYKAEKKGGFLGILGPWNPHYISSTSCVKKEAIAYYESPYFTNDKRAQGIYAQHIVCLLRGARDWRCVAGDRLISYHPTPAQMVTV